MRRYSTSGRHRRSRTLNLKGGVQHNNCISFLYDLDDDSQIDVIQYRRWNGNISAPIRAYYDKNGDMEISCDEVARWKDPFPEAGPCPPRKKTGPNET